MRPEHRIEITHYSTLDNLLNTAVEQLGAKAAVAAIADYLFELDHSDAVLARWAKDYAENELPFPPRTEMPGGGAGSGATPCWADAQSAGGKS